MRPRSLAVAAVLGFAILTGTRRASAEKTEYGWIFGLSALGAAGPVAVWTFGVAQAWSGKTPIQTGLAVGVSIPAIGGGLAAATALASLKDDGVRDVHLGRGAITFVGGLWWSMGGVLIGMKGATGTSHGGIIGGSYGLTSFALYQGVLATVGRNDYVFTGVSQALLGGLGLGACLSDAFFTTGRARYANIGCAVPGGVTLVHGVVAAALAGRKLSTPEPQPDSALLLPLPWATSTSAGVSVAGVF